CRPNRFAFAKKQDVRVGTAHLGRGGGERSTQGGYPAPGFKCVQDGKSPVTLHVKGGEGHHIAGGIEINRFHTFIDQRNVKLFGGEGGLGGQRQGQKTVVNADQGVDAREAP